jgi:hypothetical protein
VQKKAASKVQAAKKVFRKMQQTQAELDDYEDELLQPGNSPSTPTHLFNAYHQVESEDEPDEGPFQAVRSSLLLPSEC